MRCNLSCVGCYAGLYTREDDMPPELFDRIIREGEELGTYLYTIWVENLLSTSPI